MTARRQQCAARGLVLLASTKISSMNIPLNNFGAKVLDILYFFEEVAKNSSDS